MSATVLYPVFGPACCSRCSCPLPRETRVELGAKSADRGEPLFVCRACDGPHMTFTEFSAYLTDGGFGFVTPGWRDPYSPCG
jgi:hypothetical protein